MSNKSRLDTSSFVRGYACALATLISGHGMDTPIREAFSAGIGKFSELEKHGVDGYDLAILKKHRKEFERK